MKGKTLMGIIFTLIAITILAACTPQQSTQGGRAVFTMTDAADNLSAVTSIKITIDNVNVRSEQGTWTQVSSKQQTYDLLQLKASGNQVLLADYNITPGTYTQTRLYISKIIVTDASGDHTAKLPSSELKIVGKLIVNANSTSTVKFDFIADESLHTTGNGQYIFAPVVKLETRQKVDVDTQIKENVKINGGTINEQIKVGMDIDGKVDQGLSIKSGTQLSIDAEKISDESDLSAG